MDFDAAAFVDEELVLLGIFPRKIMWFSLDGEFLRDVVLRDQLGPGVFSEYDERFYLYSPTREPEKNIVKSVDKSFQDTMNISPITLKANMERIPGEVISRKASYDIAGARKPGADCVWVEIV